MTQFDTIPAALMPPAVQERGVQLRGSSLARSVMRLFGWRTVFDGSLPARQGVLVAYPHTSNWDFIWGMLAKWAMGLPLVFWCKGSLFRIPLFGAWLRWLGGMPVERHAPSGAVGAMAERLKQAREADRFMWLGLSPEGTRRFQPAWRTGFYRIALQAGVPLAVAYFDYPARTVGLAGFVRLSGDEAADMAAIAALLKGRVGKKPDQAAPIQLPKP